MTAFSAQLQIDSLTWASKRRRRESGTHSGREVRGDGEEGERFAVRWLCVCLVVDWQQQPSQEQPARTVPRRLVRWWFDMKIAWNYWINICSNWAQACRCLWQGRSWQGGWHATCWPIWHCVCVCGGILLPKRIRHDWLHWVTTICSLLMLKCFALSVFHTCVRVCV